MVFEEEEGLEGLEQLFLLGDQSDEQVIRSGQPDLGAFHQNRKHLYALRKVR